MNGLRFEKRLLYASSAIAVCIFAIAFALWRPWATPDGDWQAADADMRALLERVGESQSGGKEKTAATKKSDRADEKPSPEGGKVGKAEAAGSRSASDTGGSAGRGLAAGAEKPEDGQRTGDGGQGGLGIAGSAAGASVPDGGPAAPEEGTPGALSGTSSPAAEAPAVAVAPGPASTVAPRQADAQDVSGAESRVNLNRAGAAELETLPGIGPSRSRAILELRRQLGGTFKSVEQLLDVKGIGEKSLEKLRPHVTLGP